MMGGDFCRMERFRKRLTVNMVWMKLMVYEIISQMGSQGERSGGILMPWRFLYCVFDRFTGGVRSHYTFARQKALAVYPWQTSKVCLLFVSFSLLFFSIFSFSWGINRFCSLLFNHLVERTHMGYSLSRWIQKRCVFLWYYICGFLVSKFESHYLNWYE